MSEHLFNFGLSQEDERSEQAALALSSSSHVLSVCSGGEMPLSLLAMGADRVHAVDIDPAQLHLARLKLAAACVLPRPEAIRFLGYSPAEPGERTAAFERVQTELPEEARTFFAGHAEAVAAGVIWAGRYERYVSRLVKRVRMVLGRTIDRFFDCESLEEQERFFARHFDRWFYHWLFAVAFHPRVFRGRGMDPRSLAQRKTGSSLGQQYFRRFATMCTAHPARENHLLQLHLLGRVVSDDAVPAYLSDAGVERLRSHRDQITFEQNDLVDAMRALPTGTYDCFHLSNLPDWMDAEGFAAVMELLADKGADGARAVWRFIHVDRPVPSSIARIRADSAARERLTQSDRFPFYTVVPVTIGPVA